MSLRRITNRKPSKLHVESSVGGSVNRSRSGSRPTPADDFRSIVDDVGKGNVSIEPESLSTTESTSSRQDEVGTATPSLFSGIRRPVRPWGLRQRSWEGHGTNLSFPIPLRSDSSISLNSRRQRKYASIAALMKKKGRVATGSAGEGSENKRMGQQQSPLVAVERVVEADTASETVDVVSFLPAMTSNRGADYIPPHVTPGAFYERHRAVGDLPSWAQNNLRPTGLSRSLDSAPRSPLVAATHQLRRGAPDGSLASQSQQASFSALFSCVRNSWSSQDNCPTATTTLARCSSQRPSQFLASLLRAPSSFLGLIEAEPVNAEKVVYATVHQHAEERFTRLLLFELFVLGLLLMVAGFTIGRGR